MMDISGKTSIVTGAASGIGMGIATALAEMGQRNASRARFEASMRLRESAHAARALALLAPDATSAWPLWHVCGRWDWADGIGQMGLGRWKVPVYWHHV